MSKERERIVVQINVNDTAEMGKVNKFKNSKLMINIKSNIFYKLLKNIKISF